MAVYQRVRLESLPPPSPGEAMLDVFRSAMRYYVSHREIRMPRMVTTTLLAMHQSADDPKSDHAAMLFVGCSVLQRYGVSSDDAVQLALLAASKSLKAYQA